MSGLTSTGVGDGIIRCLGSQKSDSAVKESCEEHGERAGQCISFREMDGGGLALDLSTDGAIRPAGKYSAGVPGRWTSDKETVAIAGSSDDDQPWLLIGVGIA